MKSIGLYSAFKSLSFLFSPGMNARQMNTDRGWLLHDPDPVSCCIQPYVDNKLEERDKEAPLMFFFFSSFFSFFFSPLSKKKKEEEEDIRRKALIPKRKEKEWKLKVRWGKRVTEDLRKICAPKKKMERRKKRKEKKKETRTPKRKEEGQPPPPHTHTHTNMGNIHQREPPFSYPIRFFFLLFFVWTRTNPAPSHPLSRLVWLSDSTVVGGFGGGQSKDEESNFFDPNFFNSKIFKFSFSQRQSPSTQKKNHHPNLPH